jgi:HrpA-like RNA helicase
MLLKAFGMMKKIIVTEPRVIAAIAAAGRVARELLCLTHDPRFSL